MAFFRVRAHLPAVFEVVGIVGITGIVWVDLSISTLLQEEIKLYFKKIHITKDFFN